MSFKFVAVATLASLSLAACGKGSAAQNNAEVASMKTQMAGGWYKDCSTKNIAWSAVGVGSERMKALFGTDGQETQQLYSDADCKAQVAKVVYSIKTEVGPQSAAEESSWINLDFQKVEATISDQAVLDKVNASPVAACGIKTWTLNKTEDITQALKSTESAVTCPFHKPGMVYDIVKADGQTMHFGDKATGRNGETDAARPLVLDKATESTFHHE